MIRHALPADLPAMHQIFAAEVIGSTSSYEETPPGLGDYRDRFDRITSGPFVWLAAEVDGRIAGFAYYSAFRERPGYRLTVENSVYVSAAFRGRGLATALMRRLIAEAREAGFHRMVAVIGDADNVATLRLHARCGFTMVGTLGQVGRKFDRWLDLVIMQRDLSVD